MLLPENHLLYEGPPIPTCFTLLQVQPETLNFIVVSVSYWGMPKVNHMHNESGRISLGFLKYLLEGMPVNRQCVRTFLLGLFRTTTHQPGSSRQNLVHQSVKLSILIDPNPSSHQITVVLLPKLDRYLSTAWTVPTLTTLQLNAQILVVYSWPQNWEI